MESRRPGWTHCHDPGKALRSSDSVSSPGNGSPRACAECSVQCGREEVPGVGGRQVRAEAGSIAWGRGSEQVCWDPAGAHVGDRRVHRRGEGTSQGPVVKDSAIPLQGTQVSDSWLGNQDPTSHKLHSMAKINNRGGKPGRKNSQGSFSRDRRRRVCNGCLPGHWTLGEGWGWSQGWCLASS